MKMRRSRVLQKLRAGQIVNCVKLNLSDARIAELAAMCGFDCQWIDMEHVPTDWSVMENQIRAAKLYDTDTLVRVAKGCYSDYIRPLEADAAGIMVPHLMTADEARQIVHYTRFHPVGRRPVDGGNVDGSYCLVPFAEYIKTANSERFLVVQIEDPEPLDELEQIAKIQGIDMLFFGPADFSQGIGTPGIWDNTFISETRKRIVDVARSNGKFAGTVGTIDNAQELSDMGYQFLGIAADVSCLGPYFQDVCSRFAKISAAKDKVQAVATV